MYEALPRALDQSPFLTFRPSAKRRRDGGRWIYNAANSGARVRLSDGTILDVDAIFAGVFELPGG